MIRKIVFMFRLYKSNVTPIIIYHFNIVIRMMKLAQKNEHQNYYYFVFYQRGCVQFFVLTSLSLSLSLYIYIYIYHYLLFKNPKKKKKKPKFLSHT